MISVVAPVYKVEKYLPQCIESILRQTYKEFELILVDDGSPDRCGEICDQYAAQDSRIQVVHQENGGFSAARNAGVDRATGDYLMFIDSDDYLHEEMLATLYRSLVESGADMVACCYQRVDVEGHPDDYFDFDPVNDKLAASNPCLLSGKETLRIEPILSLVRVVPWGKLYKRELFSTLRFPLNKCHEDNWVSFQVIFSCSKILTIPERLYFYRDNPKGFMNSYPSFESNLCFLESVIDRMNFYEKNGLRDVSKRLVYYLADCYFRFRDGFPTINSADDKERLRRIKRGARRCLYRYFWRLRLKEIVYFEFPAFFKFLKSLKGGVGGNS